MEIRHVGLTCPTIICEGNSLPTNRQVLQNFFHHKRVRRLSKSLAATRTVDNLLPLWKNLQCSTLSERGCHENVLRLFDDWEKERKNNGKNQCKLVKFLKDLNATFIVSVKPKMRNPVEAQNKVYHDMDAKFVKREFSSQCNSQPLKQTSLFSPQPKVLVEPMMRNPVKAEPLETQNEVYSNDDEFVNWEFSSESSLGALDESPLYSPDPEERDETVYARKRGSRDVVNADVALALDRCSISDRNASNLISAISESLGFDPSTLKISFTTIGKRRKKFREVRAKEILENISTYLAKKK